METSYFIFNAFSLPVLNKSQILGNNCVSCRLSKSIKLPLVTSTFHAEHPLHYLYVDVWGLISVSIDGSKYFLLIVDLFFQYYWLYLLHVKSQVYY